METLLSYAVIVASIVFLVAIIFSGIREKWCVARNDGEDKRKSRWRGYSRDRS